MKGVTTPTKRGIAQAVNVSSRQTKVKAEGTIASVFASMSGNSELTEKLPARFADLKASLIGNADHAVACKLVFY